MSKSNYENAAIETVQVGDTVFADWHDREVLACDYRPSYRSPGRKHPRPVYLMLLEGEVWRREVLPGRTVVRRKSV